MQKERLVESLFKGECVFVIGAVNIESIPMLALSEFAFVGRSNVGKSSLINSIVNRNSLARVSQNPGCTKQINFFNLANQMHLVDLPGYGFARVSKKEKAGWDKLIHDYLRGRQQLKRVFLLIDSRHPIKDTDIKTMKFLDDYAINYQLVLTKIDKTPIPELKKHAEYINSVIKKHAACHPNIILTSSETKEGIELIRQEIFELRNF
jgi:GTP-binding protein